MLPQHCLKKKIKKNSWKTKGNPTIAFSISPLALLWSHSISKLIFVDKHLRATLKVNASFPFDFLPQCGWRFYSPRDSVLQPLKGISPSAWGCHGFDSRWLLCFHLERQLCFPQSRARFCHATFSLFEHCTTVLSPHNWVIKMFRWQEWWARKGISLSGSATLQSARRSLWLYCTAGGERIWWIT